MNYYIAALLGMIIIVLVLVFLGKAMKSKYSVEMDFKLPLCAVHLGMQPNARCLDSNGGNKISTAKVDKAIKK